MLEAMLFLVLAVAYYIPLSLLVDGRFLIGGFAFALFWCKEYYERLVQEGYWVERIASRIWLTSTLILVPVLPIIYGAVLGLIIGWDAMWKGAVIGGAIALKHYGQRHAYGLMRG